MQRELIAYEWDERTEMATFEYGDLEDSDEDDSQTITQTEYRPFNPPAPTVESYWGELLWYLRTQVSDV